jgi:calcium-dependent protein kinase
LDFSKDRHKLKVKVIDFGLACKLSDDGFTHSYQVGSPLNKAPEVLNLKKGEQVKYTNKVDVWAVGVLFFEMIYGYPPFWAIGKQAPSWEME